MQSFIDVRLKYFCIFIYLSKNCYYIVNLAAHVVINHFQIYIRNSPFVILPIQIVTSPNMKKKNVFFVYFVNPEPNILIICKCNFTKYIIIVYSKTVYLSTRLIIILNAKCNCTFLQKLFVLIVIH